MIQPYVTAILQALLPKLRESNAGVASCVLSTIGELANVEGEHMKSYMDDLLPVIVEVLPSALFA